MKQTNVGVIGVGSMGYNHVRIYSELENANLVAISDMVRGTLDKVSKEFNTVGYVDYDNILQIDDIEVVNICVPTVFHHDVVMRAIEAGKNVLVEKPIASKLNEAEEMIKAAEDAGVTLATGHVERFNPAVRVAKKLIDEGAIGEVVTANSKRLGPFPPRIRDVGVAIDLAIHDIDIFNYLFNSRANTVFANMSSKLKNCEFEDHAEIMTKYDSGVLSILETNWLTPYKKRQLNITGIDGIISVDYGNQTVTLFKENNQVEDIKVENKEPLKEELRSFVDCVQNNTPPEVSGKDGYEALRIVDAAMTSSKDKRLVYLD
ncbi:MULTISPECIES: Gfo/Idh/MocA family protein [Methanosphaera]|jgi:UDP-N-acetylglucosamine 3-dehydrogenase|uniref:Predicted dehydrogenase n=2 Tax=Methanosphaera stadtmanae TaxID=2317 RepID=Q2NEP3_METST|nr:MULTISPECIES: Gfo/Idh/MocA family oxidoreductase [Methanosphaera]ABC57710.1 predicted dehydrogenase [Methanosphaera stadtmanae DSM 3091]MDO5821442.1 Gfo/Idh/MocA family oxidoreductase [Methanosphaera sp.]MEE0490306.1 Gfo/Idh/MocA family oxidoreductase [Methanosphaera stadtmanae]OEC92872.1 oxidoreductase [Methanosphaera sp. A6]RAP02629.1 oxidoreductase [Methanosphaera stadtmanae]